MIKIQITFSASLTAWLCGLLAGASLLMATGPISFARVIKAQSHTELRQVPRMVVTQSLATYVCSYLNHLSHLSLLFVFAIVKKNPYCKEREKNKVVLYFRHILIHSVDICTLTRNLTQRFRDYIVFVDIWRLNFQRRLSDE